ncbi:MAG TPA: alpha-L-fucosidase, partial [Bacteroidota bacterium]|nr:alpha-L-fucosidase [Bacteroidota bacterium]
TLGTQWAWKPGDTIKTAQECIRILVQCVTGDGNLLLNVGPMPDGRIEPRQVKVLQQIGAWMKKYGESIYATRGGPFLNGAWGGSTFKGKSIYLHILQWDDHQLVLPSLPARIVKSTVLTGQEGVVVDQTDQQLLLRREGQKADDGDTIVKLDLDVPAGELPVVDVPSKATLEDVHVSLLTQPDQPFPGKGGESLRDGIRGTTDRMDGKWVGFLGGRCEAVLEFAKAKELSSITVGALQDQVSRIFYPTAIEVAASGDGQSYKEVASLDNGETRLDAEIRTHDFTISFPPVTARFFRVRILNRGTCPPWHEAAGSKAWVLVDEISVR